MLTGAKKFIAAAILIVMAGSLAAGAVHVSSLWTLGTLTNLSGLAANVIDISSANIQTVIGADSLNKIWVTCTATLQITNLTGSSPSAQMFIDQSYDGGTVYGNVVTFTACTTTGANPCAEVRGFGLAVLSGTTYADKYWVVPSWLRVRRTTTGTSVTDLDYNVKLSCLRD